MSLFYFLLIGGVNLLNVNIKKERRGKIDIDFLNRWIMCHYEVASTVAIPTKARDCFVPLAMPFFNIYFMKEDIG